MSAAKTASIQADREAQAVPGTRETREVRGSSVEFPEIELTEEQAEEAARIADILRAKAEANVRYVSRLLASKSNRELFGETEFQIRDAVHRLGAQGIDAALHEREKRGTSVRASSVRRAGKTRGSKATGAAE